MTFLRYVGRRGVVAVCSAYLVVIATFLLGNLTIPNQINNRLALLAYGGEAGGSSLRQGVVEAFNYDEPLLQRLVGWVVDVTSLDWGRSIVYDAPIRAVLDGRIATTLEYVVPGVVLAVTLGVVLGVGAALGRQWGFDWLSRLAGYCLLGVPVFVLATYLQVLAGLPVAVAGVQFVVPAANAKTLAAAAVGLSLLAGQLRFARAAALEQSGAAFVRMLYAKGADRRRVARHVLRNAAIPIVSISISDLLAVLVLNIYVIEAVLGLRGLADASLRAAIESDISLLIWSTLVVVVLGISASFLQDVLHGYLDPRSGTA